MKKDEGLHDSSSAVKITTVQDDNPGLRHLPYYLSWYRGIFCLNARPADDERHARIDKPSS